MASTDVILGLYSAAGLLELSGVMVTAFDVRAKARAARKWADPEPVTGTIERYSEANAAAEGRATYRQLSLINEPLEAALKGRVLLIGVALLALGIILGTVANALSALHH